MTPTRPPGNARAAAQRGSRTGRLGTNLLMLTSAAVVAVYAVGFANTQSAAEQLNAPISTPAPTSSPPPRVAAALPPAGQGRNRTGAVPTPALPTPSSSRARTYRDGTYTGSGNGRHGGITISLVVSGGKIASVGITSCQTRYPCSQIAALPAQVISRQSANIDHVSGATDSSTAYRQAVAAALGQAS
ncbi:MAG: FMN-binding protein [Anaerolineaceae bacterium]